ncbi:MAG: hypothetical protein ACUVRS_08200 [Armatimonadota bacterium]
MALIRTDPGQTKTVIALVGVLCAAVGVTVVRIKASPTVRSVAATGTSATTSSSRDADSAQATGVFSRNAACSWYRNPFARPKVSATQPHETAVPTNVRPLIVSSPNTIPSNGPLGADGSVRIVPEAKPNLPDREESADRGNSSGTSESSADADQPGIKFTLLATVAGGGWYSALVRIGDSNLRVVDIGDVLENGFRVVSISDDRMVLTNGKETIIARRPR